MTVLKSSGAVDVTAAWLILVRLLELHSFN